MNATELFTIVTLFPGSKLELRSLAFLCACAGAGATRAEAVAAMSTETKRYVDPNRWSDMALHWKAIGWATRTAEPMAPSSRGRPRYRYHATPAAYAALGIPHPAS